MFTSYKKMSGMKTLPTQTRRLTQWWLSTKGGRREIILKQGKTLSSIQWNRLKDFQSGFKLSKVNFELETACLR